MTWTWKDSLSGSVKCFITLCRSKFLKHHPTKQLLYIYLPAIQIRRTRHIGHCWRSKNVLISDVLLRIPSRGHICVGWLAKTYFKHLCANTECYLENLPRGMADRDWWSERERERERGGRGSFFSSHFDDDINKFSLVTFCYSVHLKKIWLLGL